MQNINRILVIAVMLISSFLLIGKDVKAACPTGWENYADNGSGVQRIPLSETCYMEVTYCWRTWYGANGRTDFDMYIDAVNLVGDCDSYKDDFDKDPKKYFKKAWEMVAFVVNPWQGKPKPPICPNLSNYYYKYGHSKCYGNTWEAIWVTDPNDPHLGHVEWVKRPCGNVTEDGLCWDVYKACRYWDAGCNCYKVKPEFQYNYTPDRKCEEDCINMCQ